MSYLIKKADNYHKRSLINLKSELILKFKSIKLKLDELIRNHELYLKEMKKKNSESISQVDIDYALQDLKKITLIKEQLEKWY